ncbi:MAG: dihydropteroate synthase [Candidatus Omnitrophica bacterium]|nr:dihydropteroate synthase [Candidatus Omnitrophota bacterium]
MKERGVFRFHARGQSFKLGIKTLVMGILNVTPDSFSGDGVLKGYKKDCSFILSRARKIEADGADIIDVGGESTRPGAQMVSTDEECRRVVPVVRLLAGKLSIPISVDTYKPLVAEEALRAGASIVNVIQGTPVDEKILFSVKKYNAGIVLMHMRGVPQTMQRHARYKDFLKDVFSELKKSVEKCRQFGIKESNIVVDPGIGFAKTARHNLLILKNLDRFSALGVPILVGTSRKSFIGKVLQKDVSDRVLGSLATATAAVLGGAHIVRAHDVRETREVVSMSDAILNASLT